MNPNQLSNFGGDTPDLLQKKLEPANKFDGGKPPVDLFDPEFVLEVSRVLDFGAKKYTARNWEKGMSWGRCYAALCRHLFAWWSGEDLDPESGLPHLAHAGCCLMFIARFRREQRYAQFDDRPKEEPNG